MIKKLENLVGVCTHTDTFRERINANVLICIIMGLVAFFIKNKLALLKYYRIWKICLTNYVKRVNIKM